MGIADNGEQCAETVRRYWHDRGRTDVCVWAEWVGAGKVDRVGSPFFAVKSNLVNGKPPRERSDGRS